MPGGAGGSAVLECITDIVVGEFRRCVGVSGGGGGGQLGRLGRMVILRFTAVRRLFSPFSAPLQPLFRLAPDSGVVHPRLW